jgi:hypothetical protein
MVGQVVWSESKEMAIYRPGQKVESKHHPGLIDTIIAYDPMMVPPVMLAIDPQPRYPEELILISTSGLKTFDWLNPWTRVPTAPALPSHRH